MKKKNRIVRIKLWGAKKILDAEENGKKLPILTRGIAYLAVGCQDVAIFALGTIALFLVLKGLAHVFPFIAYNP